MGIAYNTSIPSFNDLALLFDAANVRSYPGSGTSWFSVGTSGTYSTLTGISLVGSGVTSALLFN